MKKQPKAPRRKDLGVIVMVIENLATTRFTRVVITTIGGESGAIAMDTEMHVAMRTESAATMSVITTDVVGMRGHRTGDIITEVTDEQMSSSDERALRGLSFLNVS